MNQKENDLDSLSAAELKKVLEKMTEEDRYAEIMRRVRRGDTISRQFQFFVSGYEGINLKKSDEEKTLKITKKMLSDHKESMEMRRKRWKQGGCADILPFEKNLKAR